ncbi:MAG: YifB family Mg chelatase-like AAA ATPase [Lachnospiraceae bacterium]
MYSKVISGIVKGIEGILVYVEADISNGLPVFEMVGYLSLELREAKERVKTALRNQGYIIPSKKITVNLLPADLRKDGSAFDLPVAIAILISSEQILQKKTENIFFVGELGLDGSLHSIRGVLPLVCCAKEAGIKTCILPRENLEEGSLIEGITVLGANSLREVEQFLNGKISLYKGEKREMKEGDDRLKKTLDFSDVIGQEYAKRAIQVAVAGRHNMLLFGPPGSGKSMLTKRIPYISPKLTKKESLELTKIYSVKGYLKEEQRLISERPFRNPHHSITLPALIGGGRPITPGEITLSHNGILFLDELLEFPKNILESLRQPLEDKKVFISRVDEQYIFPADIMLVAATNLCPCGYYPDMKRCTCKEREIIRYQRKLSGPFFDRIDICVKMRPLSYMELQSEKRGSSSLELQSQIETAVAIQKERYQKEEIIYNSQLSQQQISKYCPMERAAKESLKEIIKKKKWSARAYFRIIKVARTVADLAGSKEILDIHIIEAISYHLQLL